MIMLYETIQPPFTYKFREMGRKKLREYFQWFIAKLPEGTYELRNEVQRMPGYELWEPDFTPDSLNLLGEWFAAKVETRQRSYQEIEEIRYRSAYPFDIRDEELTDRTFSYAVDIGMYLSQLFIKNHPSLKWEQPFGNKKSIDYGQPVLMAFTYGAFNPVRMMVTMAYAFADKKWDARTLRGLYDNWSAKIKP
jgi:hypothetical protein